MLRVRLLGGLAVSRAGVAVPVAGTPARLLGFLALHRELMHREAVAARLWPERAADVGRANLRTTVWALRKAVGAEAVVASRGEVGLAPQRVWVDVAEIVALGERGESRAAVELCRGELLPEFGDDWACQARAAHHERHAALLDQLAQQAEANHDPSSAVRWSRLRCALDPLNEPAHCRLVCRLAAAGDRAGGLVEGREFTERLWAELRVAPGPEMRAVLAELRQTHSAVSLGRADSARRHHLPMFGRSAELAQVMAAWAHARTGAGRAMLITGEGGIGKTRLVREVARRVAGSGARVAVGAGVDVGGQAPLAIWQELTRELVATIPPPPHGVGWPGELGRLAPDLASALGHPGVPPPVAAPELERLRVFDAVLRLLEWAAAHQPVLLVAEDLHRADRASLALCAHIGRQLPRLPVLFLLTRRGSPERPDADALLADLAGRRPGVDQIELDPLTEGELAAVVRSIATLPDDQVHLIAAHAEGNPLLAVEQARAQPARSSKPPSSLRAMVRAAIGTLPTPARELVEVVATAGRALTPGEVAALGLPNAEHAELRALDCDLLHQDPNGLRFRHALLAEAARADLIDPGRRHLQLAEAIESAAGPSGGDQVASQVARHLQLAGRLDLAGTRWRRAATHARSLGALPDAAAFWAQAVRCAPTDPQPRLELAEVLAWQGHREDFEQAWEAAIALVPPPARAAAWARRGGVLRSVLCHPSAGTTAYQQALELLPTDALPDLRASILAGLAQLLAVTGDPEHTTGLLDQADRLAPTPVPDLAIDLATARLLLLIRLGRFDELETAAAHTARLITHMNRPDQAFAGLVTAACGLAAGGKLTAALRTAEHALALTQDIPVLTLPCLAVRAHLLSRLGRHDDALNTANQQLALAERLDSPAFAALAQNDAGLVALAAGRHVEASALLGAALAVDHARISRPASRLSRAEALARLGDHNEATAELRRAVLEPVTQGDQPWALVPRMCRVQGLIALATGNHTQATRRFIEAIAAWQRLAYPDPGQELMASLVDLGRPPVVGLVEPAYELSRLQAELNSLEKQQCPTSP